MSETRRGFLGKVAGVAVASKVPRLVISPESDAALAPPTLPTQVSGFTGGWDLFLPRVVITDADDWRATTPRARWERGE